MFSPRGAASGPPESSSDAMQLRLSVSVSVEGIRAAFTTAARICEISARLELFWRATCMLVLVPGTGTGLLFLG